MKRKKEDLVVEQNEFWRKETTLTHDKQQFSTDLRNKESQLHGMIGRSTLNGINAIKGRGFKNFFVSIFDFKGQMLVLFDSELKNLTVRCTKTLPAAGSN